MNRLQQWAMRHNISVDAYNELCWLFADVSTGQVEHASETGLNALLRLEAPRQAAILWRNNSGATLDKNDRLIRYGLGNDSKRINDVLKSSDLIGITPVQWHGKVFGVFTAIESKSPGWKFTLSDDRAAAQNNFLRMVASMGGIATFATSIGDYQRLLIEARQ